MTGGLVGTFDGRATAPENPIDECIAHLNGAGDTPHPFRTPDLLRLSTANVPPGEYRHDHVGGDERAQEPRVKLASDHSSSLPWPASTDSPSPIPPGHLPGQLGWRISEPQNGPRVVTVHCESIAKLAFDVVAPTVYAA
jgi:hypothetical protein